GLERRPDVQARRGVLVPGGHRRPGGNRPPVERDHRQRRPGQRVRLVQGQVGPVVADHPTRPDRGGHRSRSRRRQARVRRDDDDVEDRHRRDRGRAAWLTPATAGCRSHAGMRVAWPEGMVWSLSSITWSLPMTPIITAFESSPDHGRGLARDMRVRWALEEVGQPYDVRLVSFKAMKEPAHLALHPFGQIPTYEEGDLALFESGAIVLHIAER